MSHSIINCNKTKGIYKHHLIEYKGKVITNPSLKWTYLFGNKDGHYKLYC